MMTMNFYYLTIVDSQLPAWFEFAAFMVNPMALGFKAELLRSRHTTIYYFVVHF